MPPLETAVAFYKRGKDDMQQFFVYSMVAFLGAVFLAIAYMD